MPVYHFNVHDGSDFPDRDGIALPDLQAARRQALQLAGELLRDQGENFWNGEDWKVEVTDAANLVLFTILFAAFDAPAIAPSSPTM